jgi:hypothetical protein
METLKKFIAGSNSFCAFSFQGRYDMDEDMFLKLYDHYLKTGENYLDVYSELMWLKWQIGQIKIKSSSYSPVEIHDSNECDKLKKYVAISRKLNFFDNETNNAMIQHINKFRDEYADYLQKHPKYRKYKEALLGTPIQKIGPA